MSWTLAEYQVGTKEERSRQWRDSELTKTDWIVSVSDHPEHSAYLAYRQALRDWPASLDFPNIKPTL